ncbi:MAG: alpha/beta hydrolase [Cyanobacteria bacterium CRU_2_1]|nr:alpha/beta hydrolase [Cyanobacteria bacterium RU_5_0]NJR62994.1 alpha/beta hydrolase [Cyanobacteria bacterium CRU_2_1]
MAFFLKLSISLTSLLGILYLSACGFLYFRQTRMLFLPSTEIEVTPTDFDLAYEEVWLPVAKGERMHGWWIPANGSETGTLLYLHGNGINIGANVEHANRYHQLGFSVLLMDYRGYGRSEGEFPNEVRVYQDARRMWEYLTQERQIPADRIFVYGHSLGGAIAIELMQTYPDAAGLIVESSFTSVRNAVERTTSFGIFPIDLLLTQRFESIDKVASLQLPVLFIHGTSDSRIPSDMSELLYAATPEPKQLYLVPGADHNNVAEIAGSEYFRVVGQFIQQATILSLKP